MLPRLDREPVNACKGARQCQPCLSVPFYASLTQRRGATAITTSRVLAVGFANPGPRRRPYLSKSRNFPQGSTRSTRTLNVGPQAAKALRPRKSALRVEEAPGACVVRFVA
jgi:hypothetical protein